MKKFYINLLCTAALVAAMGFAGCSNMDGGKQTTQSGVELTQQQADEKCPDGKCPEKDEKSAPSRDIEGEDDNKEQDGCPDKGDCHKRHGHGKGKKGKRGRIIAPRGSADSFRRKPKHPKLPKDEQGEDDVILPDPSVETVPEN